MNRSLKTLVLALIVSFALTAVAPSFASAAPKWTPRPEEYPVTWKGMGIGSTILELEKTRQIECTTASHEGHISSKAEAEKSELTTMPGYSGCRTTILGNKDLTTITMNGCDYLRRYTATTEGTIRTEGWEVTGEVEIKCPEGREIEIHVFATEAKDMANEPLCTYKIKPQKPAGDIDSRLTEKNGEGAGTSSDTKSTLTGIAVTRATGTATSCGAVTQNGEDRGEMKVEWFNSKGEMIRGIFED